MPVQQPSRKVAAYRAMFTDPAENAEREVTAARERDAAAQRAVSDLRKITAKAPGAELDDAALAALADEIVRLLGFTTDRAVLAAIIREMLPAYIASLAES